MRGAGWRRDENWTNAGRDTREGGRNSFERPKFPKIWIRKHSAPGTPTSNLGTVSGVLANLKYGYKNVTTGSSRRQNGTSARPPLKPRGSEEGAEGLAPLMKQAF